MGQAYACSTALFLNQLSKILGIDEIDDSVSAFFRDCASAGSPIIINILLY